MKFKGVIFDLDGTLINSEIFWRDVWFDFMKFLGIESSEEERQSLLGTSMHETMTFVKQKHKLPHAVEELVALETKISEVIYTHKAGPMPGANELVRAAHNLGAITAIASGSPIRRIEAVVSRLGWKEYFDALVSSEHVHSVGKPDPAIFHYTLRTLDFPASSCVVIEDSINGVKAAKAAGITCIAVPDKRVRKQQFEAEKFALADIVVDSLADPALAEYIGITL